MSLLTSSTVAEAYAKKVALVESREVDTGNIAYRGHCACYEQQDVEKTTR